MTEKNLLRKFKDNPSFLLFCAVQRERGTLKAAYHSTQNNNVTIKAQAMTQHLIK